MALIGLVIGWALIGYVVYRAHNLKDDKPDIRKEL